MLNAQAKAEQESLEARAIQEINHKQSWSEPQELPEGLPDVPSFADDLVPDAFRPWISDISDRMQCPLDFTAVGALVSVSAVVGRRLGIHPKKHDDWVVVPNLWGGVVGRPGILKTPSLAEVMRPLRRLEAVAADTNQNAQDEYEIQKALLDGELKGLKRELASKKCRNKDLVEADIRSVIKEQQQKPPAYKRYETNDASVEKLGEILRDNPNGVLVFRDELTGLLKSLDREEKREARAFYLEAWDGTHGFTYDRIGRGTVRIDSACVSLLGGIQPGPLTKYVRDASRSDESADGLLQRIQLLVFPDESPEWINIDRRPDMLARDDANAVFERLNGMEIETDEEGIPAIRFDDAVQEAFDAWRHTLERQKLRSGEPEIIESHLSKYRSLIPSIALLSYLVDGGTTAVTLPHLERAIRWGDYLEGHARRIYSITAVDNPYALHSLAERIRRRDLEDGFTARVVYRHGWQHLDREATYAALDTLEELHWVRSEIVETGGKDKRVYQINPSIRGSNGKN